MAGRRRGEVLQRGGGLALRQAKRPLRSAWRRRILSRAIDETAVAARRSLVVVAPHPDDEVIGCGATIGRRRSLGTNVDVVVVTDGRHSHHSTVISAARLAELRQQESRRACRTLGVAADRVHFLGFEEGRIIEDEARVVVALAELLARCGAEEIVVTSPDDWQPDHAACHRVVVAAARQIGFDGLVRAYPIWFWADGPWRTRPTDPFAKQLRNFTGDLRRGWQLRGVRRCSTEGFDELKRAAFACYESQTTKLSGEKSWATFDRRFLDPFAAVELFFPVEIRL